MLILDRIRRALAPKEYVCCVCGTELFDVRTNRRSQIQHFKEGLCAWCGVWRPASEVVSDEKGSDDNAS